MIGRKPVDFHLPASVCQGAQERPFGVYVHVPFCAVRCGYCDFNTYTAAELGGGGSRAEYGDNVRQEIAFATNAMRERGERKSKRLNSSHVAISYVVLCLQKKN